MPLSQVVAGNRILASDLNAYYNLLKGVAASGESITLIYNAAGVVVLQPSSDPAASTQFIQVKNNAGTVKSALTAGGGAVFSAQVNFAQGSTIASAGTTDLSTVAGNYAQVSGTTTITALGTVQAGTVMILEFQGILTLTHNATSLILRGGANATTAAGDIYIFVSEGSGNWREISHLTSTSSASVDVQTFTSGTSNWNKPAGAKTVQVILFGAGGGGAGGRGDAAGTVRVGGTSGGGGVCVIRTFDASLLGATESVVIGAAGTAGAGGSSAYGVRGGVGGTSSFGSHFSAYGGGGGDNGDAGGNAAYGGGGAGNGGAGGTAAGAAGTGGNPVGATTTKDRNGGSGAVGGDTNANNAGRGEWGGGGGSGSVSTGGAGTAGGSSLFSGPGGGSGGGLTTGNAEAVGGAGGATNSYTNSGGGAAGAANGGAGGAGTSRSLTGKCGDGGGGGGSQDSGTGGVGGAGGVPSGGGGGGGGGTTTGGGGGLGGRGECIVYTWS